jgi:PAS domain S-box-containing protein
MAAREHCIVMVVGGTDSCDRVVGILDGFGDVDVTRPDSDDALSALDETRVDAVFVGERAGGMSGVEFAAALHEGASVPVVLVASEGIAPMLAANAVGIETVIEDVANTDDRELTDCVRSAIVECAGGDQTYERTRARLAALFENSAEPIFTHTLEGEFVDANPAACDLMGYSVEELRGMGAWELVAEFAKSELQSVCHEMNVGDSETVSGTLECADGSHVPVEIHSRKYEVDGNGRLVAQVREVTERERAKAELESNQAVLEELHRITSEPGESFEDKVEAVLSLGCRYLNVEAGFVAEMTETVERMEYVVGDVDGLSVGIEMPREKTYCRRMLDQPGPLGVTDAPAEGWAEDPAYEEWGLHCYLGTAVEVCGEEYGTVCFVGWEPRSSPFSDFEQTFIELVSQWVGNELTQREQATKISEREQELVREQAFVDSIFESLPDALYAVDTEGKMVRWNDHITDVTGYTDEEIAEMDALNLLPEEDHEEVIAMMNQTLTGGKRRVESKYITDDGERIPYEFTGAPIEDENGDIIGLTGVGRDITERKEYEETLKSLHRTTRELVKSESPDEVSRRLVDTAAGAVDVAGPAVYLYDEGESGLVPTARQDPAKETGATTPVIAPGEGPVWEAFVDGESVVSEDPGASLPGGATDTYGEGLFVPMGDHGVLSLQRTARRLTTGRENSRRCWPPTGR